MSAFIPSDREEPMCSTPGCGLTAAHPAVGYLRRDLCALCCRARVHCNGCGEEMQADDTDKYGYCAECRAAQRKAVA